MGEPVDDLVALFTLDQLDTDVFTGRTMENDELPRIFGGQVAAQALAAAGRTVGADRPVHSLHAYFLDSGLTDKPVTYTVERLRDGRSFSHRQVTARQGDRQLLRLMCAFHVPEPGYSHSAPMPVVPAPDELPSVVDELRARLGDELPPLERQRAFEMRYVDRLAWTPQELEGLEPVTRMWLRTVGPMPDDPLLHACAYTYASDMTSLDAGRRPHEPLWDETRYQGISLDHALWFHRPFRMDEWLLVAQRSPAAEFARASSNGYLYRPDGTLVASYVQEALLRRRT